MRAFQCAQIAVRDRTSTHENPHSHDGSCTFESVSASTSSRAKSAYRWLTPQRVWTAVTAAVLGSLAVVIWSVWKGASWESLMAVRIHWSWIWAALACVVLRDAGYVLRLLILARGELQLKRATSSVMLWELASAMTPSVVGGSAMASFILHRNGLTWGRSIATVMSTALLDELYFLLAVPVIAIAVGLDAFMPESAPWLEGSVAAIFAGGYAFMATLAIILSTALFLAPNRVQTLLTTLFNGNLLKRWRFAGEQLALDLNQASGDLKTMSWSRWMAAVGATWVSWTARFLTLNALFMAFVSPMTSAPFEHFDIWARQLSLWTVLMISPTPGSSGLAELALPTFMSDALPITISATVWAASVLMWRYLTYHLYVIVGGVLMPFWLAQTSPKRGAS